MVLDINGGVNVLCGWTYVSLVLCLSSETLSL